MGNDRSGTKRSPNKKNNEDCLDGWKDVADMLIIFNHNNILRVYSYEEDVANGWRYFALEPYSATLYDYCNSKYKGAMPNESQVLYQITNGVSYLHGKRIVHGDLNPLNVVIAAQSRPVRMKISDFGLSKFSYSKRLLEKGENISSEVKLCLRKYWTLSEETDSLEGIKDATEDVVAAGCILFYYLTRGGHLFGCDSKSILINLKKNNPVNLENLGKNHFAYEPIKNMINPPGKGFNWLQVANEEFKEALSLQVNTSKRLGSGTFGQVFEGTFNGDPVAVKQMSTTTAEREIIQREMSTHIELSHVNVVKLWHVADSADNKFTHLALELCAGTLMDYCQNKYSGPKLPPDELVLYQIANGLHYIHSRNLVHRDIKPENILISMTAPVQMKVSDLSFVKKTREDFSETFSQSEIRGAFQWLAPERLVVLMDTENKSTDLPHGTIKSDTFSSGCVFFYFLTRGTHPFGKNQVSVPTNIVQNKPEELDNYKQNLAADDVNGRIPAGLIKLIEDMIQFKEEERIGLPEVIKQLAAVLYGMDKSKCQLRLVEASLGGDYIIRSHPTEPILVYANEKKLIFYTTENLTIPFSNWRKKKEIPFHHLNFKRVYSLEWNINGTRLAARFFDLTLVVWSYPECEILFQKKFLGFMTQINWNSTRPNLFAAYHKLNYHLFVCDSSIGDVITTIDCENVAVKWISENRIAVSSFNGTIKIFEMEENNLTTTRLLKEFTHGKKCYYLEWNERTQYLASGGDKGIKIWSMDDDKPIYSLELEEHRSEFAWRLCTGNGEEEGGIEMARKSAKNFTFAYFFFKKYKKPKSVSIAPTLPYIATKRRFYLESSGKRTTAAIEDTVIETVALETVVIETVAFSSDGRFLVAGGNKNLMIWSAEDWVQICQHGYKIDIVNMDIKKSAMNISFFTTKSTNLYENKLIVHYFGFSRLLEFAFEESNISDSGSEISTESDEDDILTWTLSDRRRGPFKRLKALIF
ncbi:uncharacterized protein LOC116936145 isoform X2 [Daphnia magna]|uniref:uncharacterized protein LOC116936145 isoform X2 n=1 Tax=Daphnia magna TaxID=35525 RepID=UPI001E1BC574|nr:uncharacterized protein LOC116936145 isoform X2 [Daphnia magna]